MRVSEVHEVNTIESNLEYGEKALVVRKTKVITEVRRLRSTDSRKKMNDLYVKSLKWTAERQTSTGGGLQ